VSGVRLDVVQGTDAWLAARVGRLTGSRAPDMLATLKNGGEAAARRDLRLQLAVERLTGRPADDRYVSREMQHGIDTEAAARAAYEAHTGNLVEPVGFIQHGELLAGCSPDGLVGDDGLVELKAPKSTTHFGYVRGGCVPSAYVGQLLHNLWISGRSWCDFVSYDDRFPPPLQLFVVRFAPTADVMAAYVAVAERFLVEVEAETAAVALLVGVAA
jgi:hypothetical protein